MSLPNPGMDFSPFDTLPAASLDDMVENIESLADGSGLDDGAVTRNKLTTITRKAHLNIIGRSVAGVGSPFPNASDSSITFSALVPDDYVSGDLTVYVILHGLTAGNLSMYRRTYRARVGQVLLDIDGSAVFSIVSASGSNVVAYSFTIDDSNFQAGDMLRLEINRDGPGVLDTSTNDIQVDGGLIEYQGKS